MKHRFTVLDLLIGAVRCVAANPRLPESDREEARQLADALERRLRERHQQFRLVVPR